MQKKAITKHQVRINTPLLERILKQQSIAGNEFEMVKTIKTILKEKGISYVQDKHGNIIASKGKGPFPVFCAHIDTIHPIVKKAKIYKQKDTIKGHYIYSSNSGIGGDDKNGIYIALELLGLCENIRVFFFSGEESGCIGSSNIDMKHLQNVSYLIGLDRRGDSDLIMEYIGEETASGIFLDDIAPVQAKYGYKETHGFITDVFTLQDRMPPSNIISAINISVGYYKPHTKQEYIKTVDIEKAMNFAYEIYQTMETEIEEYNFSSQFDDIIKTKQCSNCGQYSQDYYQHNTDNSVICEECVNYFFTYKL